MATQVQNINKTSAGLCPHGLPPSACPICSKMGGGGGTRPGERAQKPGEMSYDECLRMGAIIRARLLAQKEGILVGISSGANVYGALELSKKYPNKKIVTIAPDGIDKYISMGII